MDGLKQHHRWPIYLAVLWILTLIAFGLWWPYLIVTLAREVERLGGHAQMSSLAFWEGGSFFVVLSALSATTLFFYFRDTHRSRALGTFFASLTHELKTPMGSICLQAETLKELLGNKIAEDKARILDRLIDDTFCLERELDKALQLSRLELGAELNLSEIHLGKYLQGLVSVLKEEGKCDLRLEHPLLSPMDEDWSVLADSYALKMIFRNLVENTLRHSPYHAKKGQEMAPVYINLNRVVLAGKKMAEISYTDRGIPFKGDVHQLGQLFYKYKSDQGSGIGLYLVCKLMKKMGGDVLFSAVPYLVVVLRFPLQQDCG